VSHVREHLTAMQVVLDRAARGSEPARLDEDFLAHLQAVLRERIETGGDELSRAQMDLSEAIVAYQEMPGLPEQAVLLC
jgi:hypothetical protein